jgi:hypothetical protein
LFPQRLLVALQLHERQAKPGQAVS